jgi:hypothetical protein
MLARARERRHRPEVGIGEILSRSYVLGLEDEATS